MMDKDQDHFIKEGADYMSEIASKWRPIEVADLKILFKGGGDENYMKFFEGLNAYCGKDPKSLSKSGKQIVKDWLDKEITEDAIDSDDFPGVIDDEYTEGVDLDRRSMGSVGEEDDYDPDHEMFLQNLRPCGFSYVLEISIGGTTKQRKYEDEDEDEDEQPDEHMRKVHKSNPSDRISQLIQKRNHLVEELKILDNEVKLISPTYPLKSTKCAQKKRTHYSSTCNKTKASYKEKSESPRSSSRKLPRKSLLEDSSSDYLQEEPIQRQSRELPKNLQKRWEPPKDCPLYSYFLRRFKVVGDCPLYADENGNKFTYEEPSDESSSDSDVVELPTPSKRMTPKPSNKRLQSSESDRLIPEPSKKKCLLSGEKGPNIVIDPSSEYRKMLMEVLSKPYDEKEHLDLWKEANVRKPVMRHRESRGGSYSYPDDSLLDKSYLDRYRDLNRAIREVKPDEPHKVLHFLRGLFFFLQYGCDENAFAPWSDKSWMEAVRKSIHH